MVREERLELSHLAILEPKSSASTNSATPANQILLVMAGIQGFEPWNDGIKTRCLTAWLYPNKLLITTMVATTGFEPVTPSL